MCEDGQIEAVSVIGAKAFVVGVQWHPEYRYWDEVDYNALIGAFHGVARGYQVKSLIERRARLGTVLG